MRKSYELDERQVAQIKAALEFWNQSVLYEGHVEIGSEDFKQASAAWRQWGTLTNDGKFPIPKTLDIHNILDKLTFDGKPVE